MTTEDDLQAELDRDITNYTLRTILADLLQDRDDVRAPGYRALGALRKWPRYASRVNRFDGRVVWSWRSFVLSGSLDDDQARHYLPGAWGEWLLLDGLSVCAQDWGTRRRAEDGAAKGFANVPPAAQRRILAHTEVVV